MKFLVIDDSATMRRIVVNTLQRLGYSDVVEAGDGLEALDKFDDSIALVITDWIMPKVNGLELTKAIRAGGSQVPILMVTTRSVREDIVAAVEAGATNYIVKPFTPQVLKDKLEAILTAQVAN